MDIKKAFRERLGQLGSINSRLTLLQEAVARIESRQLASERSPHLIAHEFRAFSQWGEDGIIQYLIRELKLDREVFVEFGVETYVESNTRFLLCNNNWSGLVIDGSEENIQYIRQDPIYWRYNLKAECSFITAENINSLIERNGVRGEIGLLSVDIDGNDYWVWKAIDIVQPTIVIAEYNARFGPERAVTTPYDPGFVRSKAHHSLIYYGASLSALWSLATAKGYALVGCNSSGNNAFFVRKDRLPASLPSLSPAEAYVRNQFREARGADGKLAFVDPQDEIALLAGLPLVTVS
jgi:hypothetical protein